MFRAIAALKKSEGFEVTNHSDYVTQQTRTFTTQYPNMLPTSRNYNGILATNNASSALQTVDPNTRQSSLRDIDITSYATTVQASEKLAEMTNQCRNANLNSVTNTPGQSQNLRCGWIYKKGTPGNIPEVSKGALGTRNGPLDSKELSGGGTWYWDINEIRKIVDIDTCSALTNCQDVQNAAFSGCAFSTERGIGIPVNANGSVKYPSDTRFSGTLGTLIRQTSQCPVISASRKDRPLLTVTSTSAGRDTCIPDANGKLSRDCYLDQIKLAGCSDQGSLYTALSESTNSSNYFDKITDKQAYTKYQQLASTPLAEATLRSGQATAAAALQNFQALKTATSSTQDNALNFAARDLCLQNGAMEEFDFCSELTPTTAAPFRLQCLQKAFKLAGGQETGRVYPSPTNITNWNEFGTWGNVINKINELKQNINSSREEIQREALANFLGIQRAPYETSQIGRIQGAELFWFNKGTNTFIGRRFAAGAAAKFPRIINNFGEIENTGLADNVESLAMVNIRPPSEQKVKLKIRSDDGFIYSKNKLFDPFQTRGKSFDTNNMFGANRIQAPTTYEQKSCWTLKANGPNYINGYWEETSSVANFELDYSPCDQTSWKLMPPEWMNLTQEPDAPMVSWEVVQGEFKERRMPYFFDFRVTGGTISTRNLDYYPYVKELSLGSRAANVQLLKQIAFNSWRSIGLQFFASENTSGSTTGFILLQIGDALTVRLLGKDVLVTLNTATLPNVQKRFTNVIDNTNSQPNYFFINCKRDGGQTQSFPNRITFAVGTSAAFKSGSITVEIQSNNVASFTTSGSQPIFTATDSAQMSLGDKTAVSSAICTVGALRLFDYEMTTSDVLRDINNVWKMKFF